MTPIRHILVPIDFSEASRHALNYGLHLARAFSADISLLHVIDSVTGPAGLMTPPASDEERQQIDREMRELIPDAFEDMPCKFHTASGAVEEKILETIEDAGIDLTVMGTHGARGFERWLLGSVTERILRRAPVPVLTVSSRGESGPHVGAALRFDRILCPTDLSDASEVALPLAVELAERMGGSVEVVHVVEPFGQSPWSEPSAGEQAARERDASIRWAAGRLDEVCAQAGETSVEIKKTVLEGQASRLLVEYIETKHPDLVVMELHGMSFLERALLGSTAERVVRASRVPVLSIPETGSRTDADTPLPG